MDSHPAIWPLTLLRPSGNFRKFASLSVSPRATPVQDEVCHYAFDLVVTVRLAFRHLIEITETIAYAASIRLR